MNTRNHTISSGHAATGDTVSSAQQGAAGPGPQADETLDTYSFLRGISTHDCRRDRAAGTFSRTTPEGDTIHVHRACHRLRCRSCGPCILSQYRAAILQAVNAHRLQYSVTLTAPTPTSMNVRKMKRCLASLMRSCRREFNADIQYIWVISGHISTGFHFCLLIDTPVPLDWLRAAWRKRTGGEQAHICGPRPHLAEHDTECLLRNYLEALQSSVGKRISCSTGMGLRLNEPRIYGSGWSHNPEESTSQVAYRHGSEDNPVGVWLETNPDAVVVPAGGGHEGNRNAGHRLGTNGESPTTAKGEGS